MSETKELKRCSTCHESKDRSAFDKNKCTKDKLQNVCKLCKNRYTKAWRHGIKSGWFEETYHKQSGLCAICNRPDKLAIDHDHLTNQIRELLCMKCNTVLGLVNEDLNILEAMKNYLIKWKCDA